MSAASKRQESHRLRVAADAISLALSPLLISARHVAASVTMGSHGRKRAGVGDSFWQFRPYSKDDTPAAIDWRQTGKFGTVFVREREWVAAQTAALWCDTSPSMRYRSSSKVPTKAERAAVMMLAMAELLIDGGERIVRLTADGRVQRAAAAGRLAVAQMADAVTTELATTASTTGMPFFAGSLPRQSTVILISDFLSPIEEIAASVRNLTRQGITGHMVQVLDPAEETLPFSGRVRFVGMEEEGTTIIEHAEDARAAYMRKLAAHRDALKALAASAGWSFGLHHTDRTPQPAMAALHNAVSGHHRR